MKNGKKRNIKRLLWSLSFVIGSSCFPMDELFEENFYDFYLNSSLPSQSSQFRSIENKGNVLVLLNQLGFIDLLQEDFFEKTFDLNKRDLLDYPLFMFPWKRDCTTKGYQFFYNATGRMYFSSNCSNISAYLSTTSNGFAEKLQAFLEAVRDSAAPGFDPNQAIEILTLAEHFTVQERRLGIMFDGEHKRDDWLIRWFWPFYLRERNHFVTPEVQDAIENILNPIVGVASQEEQNIFAEDHLITDQLGFGDFRLEFDRTVCCFPDFEARLGFLITLPFALPIAKELIGRDLQPPKRRPLFDFQILLDNEDGVLDISEGEAKAFFLSALDNLSAMLLNTKLGNNGHVGFGPIFKTASCLAKLVNRPWAENIKMRSRMSLEFQLPAVEQRFFIPRNNKAQFESRDFTTTEQPAWMIEDNYNFVVQTFTDRLFPFATDAIVYPGLIIRSTSRFIYEGEKWSCFLGSDMWIRTGESVTELHNGCPSLSCSVVLDKAEHPLAYQSKILAGIARRYCGYDGKEWIVSVNGDTTVMSTGIGLDFMLAVNVDVTF